MVTKSTVFRMLAAAALTVSAQAAYAADITNTFPVGSANFPATLFSDGSISGSIGNQGIGNGTFEDTFTFTIGLDGFGSGSISTGASFQFTSTDLDFTSVTINGMGASLFSPDAGLTQFASANAVPISAGVLNKIVVSGLSRGNGSYGGNVTFVPGSVPEPATWAMFIGGFGLIGASLRRRPRVSVHFA